ncbi:MAG: manganese efflux pump [Ruminococcaceae bacterium]|nr:manganese efflux pump [Oscillospiraceae bacterium]
MGITELLLTAVALAMDAFAISICKGLSAGKAKIKHMITVGLYFGGFQALMPLLGYWLGKSFSSLISNVAPLVACGLLLLIGINMIRESCGCDECQDADFSPKAMIPLAVATSIDALAVGIGMAMLDGTNITLAVILIGIVTFIFCAIGIKIGAVFGAKYQSAAERAGGIVLILMGLKVLLEYIFEKTLSAPSLLEGFKMLFERIF